MIARHGSILAETSDPVGAWLDLLEKLVGLPEAGEVRAELESHLRERVRDLMVEGLEEHDAVTRAIGEVGDAADLARRYRSAGRTKTRRRLMNLSILGVAGGALVVSAFSLVNPPGGQPAVFEDKASGLPTVALQGAVENTPLAEVLQRLAGEQRALVRWGTLSDNGAQPDQEVTLRMEGLRLGDALVLLNEAVDLSGSGRIEARAREGMIEFATAEYFDAAERVLASYDIGPLLPRADAEEIVGAITSLVEMENWENNGGTIAKVHVLGDRMFVEAPPRMHRKVSWILEQLGADAEVGQAPGQRDVRIYALKHTDAEGALKALMRLQSIREIDFTPWNVDPRTNSIIGAAPEEQHEWVERALRDIDRPAGERGAAGPGLGDIDQWISGVEAQIALLESQGQAVEENGVLRRAVRTLRECKDIMTRSGTRAALSSALNLSVRPHVVDAFGAPLLHELPLLQAAAVRTSLGDGQRIGLALRVASPRAYALSDVDAAAVAGVLRSEALREIVGEAEIGVDEVANAVLVRGSDEEHARVAPLIEAVAEAVRAERRRMMDRVFGPRQ